LARFGRRRRRLPCQPTIGQRVVRQSTGRPVWSVSLLSVRARDWPLRPLARRHRGASSKKNKQAQAPSKPATSLARRRQRQDPIGPGGRRYGRLDRLTTAAGRPAGTLPLVVCARRASASRPSVCLEDATSGTSLACTPRVESCLSREESKPSCRERAWSKSWSPVGRWVETSGKTRACTNLMAPAGYSADQLRKRAVPHKWMMRAPCFGLGGTSMP
jgi:hypothetical protein